jgi:hypothetical protein
LGSKAGVLVEGAPQQQALAYIRSRRDAGASYRTVSAELLDGFGVRLTHAGVQKVPWMLP